VTAWQPLEVVVVAPRGRDAELTTAMIARHGITARAIGSGELLAALDAGIGCAVVTREGLEPIESQLSAWLAAQPPWSDFPLIVLDSPSRTSAPVDTRRLGNVTLLERPVSPGSLLASVHASLRARGRQYEARNAIQQRDQFLAMLGHELRNPLGAIVLASELARTGNRDRADVANRLQVIERQANHLARLVDDLLDVARVTSGKVQLHLEPVAIDEIVASCIETLADRARARGIQLVHAATCGAVIAGDRVRLEQVITNLMTNAIKYSPGGRTVSISCHATKTACEIRVRDQGIGIEAAMLPRVFELFAQADGSLDRAEGGMGIGLTLVDRLVRLHGGRVTVHSAGLGHGSEFVVQLPRGKAPSVPGVIPLPVQAAARALRVVLVEDNADIREMMASMMREVGCTVEVAADGLEGADRIVRTLPDLAIVDIGLPGIDGYEVARRVRAAVTQPMMLVAVTGYGTTRDRDHALEAGFDLHVVKPMRVQMIEQIVEQARTRTDATCTKSAQT
jgi:signal transduction histidine kinase/ActR/RegA family two-component response regulator